MKRQPRYGLPIFAVWMLVWQFIFIYGSFALGHASTGGWRRTFQLALVFVVEVLLGFRGLRRGSFSMASTGWELKGAMAYVFGALAALGAGISLYFLVVTLNN